MEHIRNRRAHADEMDEPFIDHPEQLLQNVTASDAIPQTIEDQLTPPPPSEPGLGGN